ncbi:MAG TPA: hypothetical protein HA348_04330 [Thermoplasmata archaeon]|nr:hypothetical protein [Thermoplasmata archaeon]
MIGFEKCFIMLCTDTTEKECLERNLFGDKRWKLQYLEEIKTGDIGLLLNLSKNELIGIFKARSEPQLNIESDGWWKEFPAQVRVEPIGKIQRITNATSILEKIGIKMTKLRSGALVPQFPVHSHDVAEKILVHFREPIPIEGKITTRIELKSIIPSKLKFDDVVGLDDVKRVFATNLRVTEDNAKILFQEYGKRWGIETSYRVKQDFKARTTSKKYVVRLFYFMYSSCLYNLWVLANILVGLAILKFIPKEPFITAKMFGVMLYTFCSLIDPGGG